MHETKGRAGRPAGDVRNKLLLAYADLAQRWGGASWRDAAAHAQVPAEQARVHTKNLAHEGLLEPAQPIVVPWSRRSMAGYRPAQPSQPGHAVLADVLRGWGAA